MAARKSAAVPAPLRKTLLEWIESDDGDTPEYAVPACSCMLQTFHYRLALPPAGGAGAPFEPLAPPAGLALAPLG